MSQLFSVNLKQLVQLGDHGADDDDDDDNGSEHERVHHSRCFTRPSPSRSRSLRRGPSRRAVADRPADQARPREEAAPRPLGQDSTATSHSSSSPSTPLKARTSPTPSSSLSRPTTPKHPLVVGQGHSLATSSEATTRTSRLRAPRPRTGNASAPATPRATRSACLAPAAQPSTGSVCPSPVPFLPC
jgi:hypothetical protein